MKDQRGTSALIAIGFVTIFFLVIYMVYSLFSTPVTTTLSAIENADVNDVVPDHIIDNNQISWEIWPIVLTIVLILVAFAYIYRYDREHSYAGGGGMFS